MMNVENLLRKVMVSAAPRDKQVKGISILVGGYWVECTLEKGATERWLYQGVDFRRILNLDAVHTSYQDGSSDLFSLESNLSFNF